jgi:hypothetical protein
MHHQTAADRRELERSEARLRIVAKRDAEGTRIAEFIRAKLTASDDV